MSRDNSKGFFQNTAPGGPNRNDIQLPTSESFSPDISGLMDIIRAQGITFIHEKAMRCPVGLQDKFDTRRSHGDHSGCSNGFIYTDCGEITALFSNNKMESKLIDQGILDDSTAIISFPTNYDNTSLRFTALPFDRIKIKSNPAHCEFTETVEYNGTGRDRLIFQAIRITLNIVDARGSVYFENKDFRLDNGAIQWIPSGQCPGWNLEADKGVVYSVRYLYEPFFYVTRLLKDIRVVRVDDYISGPNPNNASAPLKHLPIQCVVQREYCFLGSNENDPNSLRSNDQRQSLAPQNGSMGPF